ncbi:hypothetical protein [Citrobacter portucalensis]|uniref:hypothetical protein n=1 Tax=Citrobacter portucalensis TaxID=1639133 RepID=UPI0021122002|nr:hypothetical protein [Citrobacter portucalensis]MCQ6312525.1 hypothetical protein [Citrobacter portucalensis]
MNDRFYMLCLRETVGTNASFHCRNGNGYSSNIDAAHVYTLQEAQEGVRLEKGNYPTLSAFFAQMATD